MITIYNMRRKRKRQLMAESSQFLICMGLGGSLIMGITSCIGNSPPPKMVQLQRGSAGPKEDHLDQYFIEGDKSTRANSSSPKDDDFFVPQRSGGCVLKSNSRDPAQVDRGCLVE